MMGNGTQWLSFAYSVSDRRCAINSQKIRMTGTKISVVVARNLLDCGEAREHPVVCGARAQGSREAADEEGTRNATR